MNFYIKLGTDWKAHYFRIRIDSDPHEPAYKFNLIVSLPDSILNPSFYMSTEATITVWKQAVNREDKTPKLWDKTLFISKHEIS